MASNDSSRQNIQMIGPFDSLRDFIRALEADGRILRIPELDQDKYQLSGLGYRLIEKLGYDDSPGFVVERIKIDGEWVNGPVLGNIYGGWDIEGIVFGVDTITDNQEQMYRAVLDKLATRLDDNGQWKRIKPIVVECNEAPCKEIIEVGDEVDLTKFAWLKSNPADAGRYINTGSLFIEDPNMKNVGTYRCQLKSKNKIGVNPEIGQDAWRILMDKKRRGEKVAKAAIALGSDPITWALSSSKLTSFGEDEMEYAGGLRGKPVEIVKAETCDVFVPAQAEIVIEGEIPLDDMEPEGPYGEMYGYLGPRKEQNFYMNVKVITHRKDPWIVNSFTGVTCDMLKAPAVASNYHRYKKMIPNLTDIITYRGAPGVTVAAIDKKFPGEGMAAGQHIIPNATVKVVIIVDSDINILKPIEVIHCMGARWQPSASVMIPQTQLRMLDPSIVTRGLSSKMIIDATRQLPEEGGPQKFGAYSRVLLDDGAPELFDWIEDKWPDFMNLWKQQKNGK